MGVVTDPTTVVTKIVSSLPDSPYLAFKKAWDSVPEASQTMPMLLARLRKEELESKQSTQSESAPKSAAYATSSKQWADREKTKTSRIDELKKRTICKNCGKVGHWYKECRK